MRHAAFPEGLTRDRLIEWYRDGRRITQQLFTIPKLDAYCDRPISLRNPIVFYEGHIPAFAVNTLIKLALREEGIDEDYEVLFARGIDPDDEKAVKNPTDLWPRRDQVRAYGRAADNLIERALCEAAIDAGGIRTEAAFAILEHEQMHQETLLYMFHNLAYERKTPHPAFGHALPAARGEGTQGLIPI